MIRKHQIIVLFLLLNGLTGFSRKDPDSLWRAYNNPKLSDSLRFDAIDLLAYKFRVPDPDSSIKLSGIQLKRAYAVKNYFFAAKAYYSMAMAYRAKEEFSKSAECAHKSIAEYVKINDLSGMAANYNHLGNISNNQGDYSRALDYFHKSIKLKEEINDQTGLANSYNNIGMLYNRIEEPARAIDYLNKCLAIRLKIKDTVGYYKALNNIGSLYVERKKYDTALYLFKESYRIRLSVGGGKNADLVLGNIGDVYLQLKQYDSAIYYLNKGYVLSVERKSKENTGSILTALSNTYFRLKQYNKAKELAIKAFSLYEGLGSLPNEAALNNLLYHIYKAQNNTSEALKYYEKYNLLKDSISSSDKLNSIKARELKYEYDKKLATDSIENIKQKQITEAQIQKAEAELKVKRNQQYALFIGLGLVLIFSGFMVNRFRVIRKQKDLIQQQNILVMEKQKEILESIHYAKRIQQSHLPNYKFLSKTLERLKK